MPDEVRASRRQLVQGVAALGVAAPILSSCGDGDGGGGDTSADGPAIRCTCHGSRFSIEDGSVLGGPANGPLKARTVTVEGDDVLLDDENLGATSSIPVGGGVVFKDQEVVVTQPEEGTFKGFSAVCTHQRCIVQEVQS